MILDKIYENFVQHTGLNDGVYKTVFIQISDILETLKDIKWQRLIYNINDVDYITNFIKDESVPLYIIEIVQNLFDNTYSFPSDSKVILELEYKNKPYIIETDGEDIFIPPELEFISDYSLFKLFLITYNVFDIFGEFDNLFNFVNSFKTKIRNIYSPLQKRFEEVDAVKKVDQKIISTSSVSNSQALIENLKKSRENILQRIDEIHTQKDKLMSDKNNMLKIVRSRESYEIEKQNLTNEYNILKDDYTSYKKTFYKFIDTLSEVEIEIQDLNYNHGPEEEKQYFIEKKLLLEKEKDTLENNLNDTKILMDNLSLRLIQLTQHLKETENFTMLEVDILSDEISKIDKEREEVYISLVSIENELKHQLQKVDDGNIELEHSKVRTSLISDMTGVDRQNIVDHLSSSLQPTSVTIVMNYLRYYFAFVTTKIAHDLSNLYKDVDISILQAVASKLALTRFFGVYYNIIFSAVKFVDNRVDHVTLINRQEE